MIDLAQGAREAIGRASDRVLGRSTSRMTGGKRSGECYDRVLGRDEVADERRESALAEHLDRTAGIVFDRS